MNEPESGVFHRRWLSQIPRLTLFAGAVLLLAAIILGAALSDARSQRQVAAGWERHTYEVLIESRDFLAAFQDAESGQRGYVLTGDAQYLELYNAGMKTAPGRLADLRFKTQDNSGQQASIARLSKVVDQRLALLRSGVSLVRNGDREGAVELVVSGRGKVLTDEARFILAAINRAEATLLNERTAANERLSQRSDFLAVGLLLLIIAMAMFGIFTLLAAARAQGKSALLEAEREATQRLREADAAAAKSAAFVSAIGDAIPDLIYAKDSDGRLIYANPSTLAVIGKPSDNLIGKLTIEYNADPAEAAAIDANDARVMAAGKTEIMDEVYTDHAGNARLFRSTKTPIRDPGGEVIGLAGVTIDVTAERSAMAELKTSEERFRRLSETVPAFIFITDDNGEITYTNSAFQKYTGKTNEDLLGMNWVRTVHRDDREIPEKAWSAAVVNQRPYSAEYRFRSHAGEFRCFMCRAAPIRDAAGHIRQWVGTCSDVQDAIDAQRAAEILNEELETKVTTRTAELQSALTTLQSEVVEREKAESQVRQMQKIESIGQLTGGIAHDFNNMLAVVLGSLEIVKRRIESDPERAMMAVENAEEGARRAAELTARLLAFSRQQPLAPEPVEANKLVSGMSTLLRSTIGEQIEIETVLAGGLWKTHIDAPQLENAILNLCVNARDAMLAKDNGGGKLTVETHNCHLDENYALNNADVEAGQFVLVCVSDTGAGMPPEVIERAFDPFYTTKEVGKGTGLGLSQVYGFVKQSGGHIKIYSEDGDGTTIKMYLPRYFGAAKAVTRSAAKDSKKLPPARPGEVVLVVEDEDQVRQVTIEQLHDLGYTILEASNGAQALQLLTENGRVDLIFTDIVMPGMTGRVLADEALNQRPDVKILYTTGYTRNAVVHNGVLDHGTEFIAKPYTGAALAKKVRSVLDKS